MEEASNYRHIFAAMGLDFDLCRAKSVYPFSPVFLAELDSRKLIVKKTRTPLGMASALFTWTQALKAGSIPVVTPSPSVPVNPVAYNDEVWVAYPFVEGTVYQGSKEEIRAAGAFLGKLHAFDFTPPADFLTYTWAEYGAASIEEDLSGLNALLESINNQQKERICERYRASFVRVELEMGRIMESPDLSWACACWDYKANNLVYTPDGPVLIDPDNAAYLPRIFDLALAALLFHNEHSSAPGRLFTQAEWHEFLGGYQEFVTFTPFEIVVWRVVLDFMRLDEGLWLLLNNRDGWQQLPQRLFLQDLLTADLSFLELS